MRKIIFELIQESCAFREEKLTLRTPLRKISLDSLSFVALLVKLEETFGIAFEDEELNFYEWRTVGELVRAVEEKKHAKKDSEGAEALQ